MGCGLQEPQQLLSVFADLEANNLFLIQNVQAAEEGIEELRTRRGAAQRRLEAEAAALRAQAGQLDGALRAEADKLKSLKVSGGHPVGFSL